MGQEAQVILRLTKVDAMQTQFPTGHSTACGEFQGPTTSQGRIMLLTKLIQPTSAATLRVPQLCPTLCDPMDRSLPGFSLHGFLQARGLEWVAISAKLIVRDTTQQMGEHSEKQFFQDRSQAEIHI